MRSQISLGSLGVDVGRTPVSLVSNLKKSLRKKKIRNIFRDPHVFVLGTQKTGTTAIAALLAKACGHSVTLDFKRDVWNPGWNLLLEKKVITFEQVVSERLDYFSALIIKEPELTYFYEELRQYFPDAQFVLVQRNPFDTIKSVLSRVEVPGDLERIDFDDFRVLRRLRAWRLILDYSWADVRPSNYIASLAYRWNIAASLEIRYPGEFTVLRYEDFVLNKKHTIEKLAHTLDLPVKQNISDFLDIQFQPKGRAIRTNQFFSLKNQDLIKNICSATAREIGYFI